MMNDPMEELLRNEGFNDGWILHGGILVLWEHKEEPPSPLVRPNETPDYNS